MVKNDEIFLEHILESIKAIEKYCKGVKKSDFKESQQLQDSVVRRLEVIGEAVRNISKNFKERNKTVEWQKIAGMRDILIHHYFGIDVNLVWATVKKDLPKLKKEINSFYRK